MDETSKKVTRLYVIAIIAIFVVSIAGFIYSFATGAFKHQSFNIAQFKVQTHKKPCAKTDDPDCIPDPIQQIWHWVDPKGANAQAAGLTQGKNNQETKAEEPKVQPRFPENTK